MRKRRFIEELWGHYQRAMKQGFYLEAMCCIYAIIEDRFDSLLIRTAAIAPHQRPIRGLERKLKEFFNIRCTTTPHTNYPYLQRAFYLAPQSDFARNLKQSIIDWKNRRNALIHALVDESQGWSTLTQNAESVAKDGEAVAKTLCDACMRFRNGVKKAGGV